MLTIATNRRNRISTRRGEVGDRAPLFRGPRCAGGSFLFVPAPGFAVDVDQVAVLGEAFDEGGDAGSVEEHGTSRLESEVRGDDAASLLVPAAEDAVEQVARARAAPDVPEVVEAQDVRQRVAAHAMVHRGDGLLFEEIDEDLVDGREAHGHEFLECSLPEVFGEGRRANAARSAKEHVLPVLEEVEERSRS